MNSIAEWLAETTGAAICNPYDRMKAGVVQVKAESIVLT
jgi:hypothetical protein